MSDKLMDTKLIDEKRQKRLEDRRKYYELKKNDEEYQRKIKEGEKRRYELRKLNPEWVEQRRLYSLEKQKQYKEDGRLSEMIRTYRQANAEKLNEQSRSYYQTKCLTDPSFREKRNERKREKSTRGK